MKGISAVIATILMLMITIALAGMAYMYISGVFQRQTTSGIEVVDVYCDAGNAVLTIRNIGTSALDVGAACTATACGSVTVAKTAPAGFGGGEGVFAPSAQTIQPGTTFTLTDADCILLNTPGSCIYRLTAPGQSTLIATVACPL